MHEKDFEGWHTLKQNLDSRQADSVPSIKEREIWWCSIGVNVGNEEDGHNELYNRPVLIVRKFNSSMFWGIALTTKGKDDPHYFPIEIKGHKRSVMLSHLRLYDTKRLLSHKSRMGTLLHEQFLAVKTALKELL